MIRRAAHRDTETRARTRRVAVSPCLRVWLLLLAVHCLLLTATAQPGVPRPNSPLYGGAPSSGTTSVGLPPVLKKVGIDQKLNQQIPLDLVFKDEQGREVRLGQFSKASRWCSRWFITPARCFVIRS